MYWINEPSKVFVARRGLAELTTTILTPDEVRDLVERMLRTSGRRVDLSSPFVDATLSDGSRLHVVIPDITRDHWHVNIRKFVVRADHLEDLVRLGTLSSQAACFLEACVVSGLNILVAGGTQAGKTTLLNCLAASIPSRERVVTCEEVFELANPRIVQSCREHQTGRDLRAYLVRPHRQGPRGGPAGEGMPPACGRPRLDGRRSLHRQRRVREHRQAPPVLPAPAG
jgi:Flp pilus assembly CpaF family ATPase